MSKKISVLCGKYGVFSFLSLIPALMLLCAILPYTPVTKANLMYLAREITPDAMDALLVQHYFGRL